MTNAYAWFYTAVIIFTLLLVVFIRFSHSGADIQRGVCAKQGAYNERRILAGVLPNRFRRSAQPLLARGHGSALCFVRRPALLRKQ